MSELAKRTLSGVAMIAAALGALWLGGVWFAVLAVLVGLAALWEWFALVSRFAHGARLVAWLLIGLLYIGGAVSTLAYLREAEDGNVVTFALLIVVWATDIGAYAAGRTFGGPKIAPRISPSKTWTGLFGAIVAASAALLVFAIISLPANDRAQLNLASVVLPIPICAGVAILAQAGDFFESWMKRKAGLKDSGKLIPGHGGVLDRIDGLLSVSFVLGIFIVFNSLGGK